MSELNSAYAYPSELLAKAQQWMQSGGCGDSYTNQLVNALEAHLRLLAAHAQRTATAQPAAPGVPDETLRQAAFEALMLIGQHAPLTTRTFSSRRLLGALCNHLESLAASPSVPE